ncbi:hypothetical protein ACFFX1_45550 [Dactylosporangium sucinum]|uniref:Uncharacterized protein n=1 Tax=Dactylosporangium sucinum TaxID=1424081 RepID=A0A917WYY9_9ACTN|nr:hypothetical protein [Dactylosporangium sucinum]GGM47713.1 hypothetical protein GCM10007977_056670 [Dactylosporangium sucinum]
MFKDGWLVGGLVASVLLRGALWCLSLFIVGPVLGPLDGVLAVATDHAWEIVAAEAVVGVLLAVATGVACAGLRRDQLWAHRLGLALARGYVALNAVTAVASFALVFVYGWLPALLGAFYLASLAAAALAWRDLAAGPRVRIVTGLATLRRLAAGAQRHEADRWPAGAGHR